jgi:hypothetical protein
VVCYYEKNHFTNSVDLACIQVKAQFIKEQAIDVSIGYGISLAFKDVDITGSGFYLQSEYICTLAK